jgi:polysaccharide biosynthesis transport protein
MRIEAPVEAAHSQDLIDIPELVRTVSRYKWGIVGLTLLTAAIAALIAFNIRPVYRGTTSILIELKPQRVVQVHEVFDPGIGLSEYYGTQYMVLRSREMAERVVDRLQLLDHPEFAAEKPANNWATRFDLRKYLPLPTLEQKGVDSDDEGRRRDAVVDALMEKLAIEPVARTQIIKVHFDAHDPELAAAVPNTLAELYIESGLEAKLVATEKATAWLTDKLTDIRDKLARSEAALQAFLESEQLVNVGGARTLNEEVLIDNSRQLREAERERANLQASYERVRRIGNDPKRLRDISQLLTDPLAEAAMQGYLSALEVVQQLEERYGSKHPQMATASARLRAAESALNEQLLVAAQGLRTKYELALERERSLRNEVAAARNQIQRLDRKNYELSTLERDVAANRELYETFLTRFKETDSTSSFETLIARVIDPAIVPRLPAAPRKKRWIMLGALGGLMLSLILAALHYALGEGIRKAEELEALTHLPVFGVLPLVSGFMGKAKSIPLLYIQKPRTPLAEGVRSIRAALELNGSGKRLMVTSAVPSEGKSSVCATLAMAQSANQRVLLLEADLRRPSLRRQLNLPDKQPGLTDVLDGRCSLDEALFSYTTGNITVLHAGSVATHPAEILSSSSFSQLLELLETRFDRILIDSPPCQAAADALVLARLVQSVLFVVKSEATTRLAIKNSLKQLRYVGAPLTGLVINQVDTRRNSSYAQGYYYAYHYYQ